MRHHAGLSPGFWKLAVDAAVHIYNRQPLRRHNWKAPIIVWDGTIPDVSYFRVFGCKAYVHTHKDARTNKLQAKAKVMIFVGYELGTKGYRFWDISTRSIVIAHDTTFDESSFPRRDTDDRAPDVPVHADTPSAEPELTSDSDPNDLFSNNHAPPDQPNLLSRNDDLQQDDLDNDNLYRNLLPPPKPHFPPQRDDPNKPRFVMGPPSPLKCWSEYRLPNLACNSP